MGKRHPKARKPPKRRLRRWLKAWTRKKIRASIRERKAAAKAWFAQAFGEQEIGRFTLDWSIGKDYVNGENLAVRRQPVSYRKYLDPVDAEEWYVKIGGLAFEFHCLPDHHATPDRRVIQHVVNRYGPIANTWPLETLEPLNDAAEEAFTRTGMTEEYRSHR